MGGPTIQFNCVSVDELRDAQAHPDAHRDLQVRICGLSAYFVALERAVQDEMIERAEMGM
jgi:formate C-acetyltransferase